MQYHWNTSPIILLYKMMIVHPAIPSKVKSINEQQLCLLLEDGSLEL